VVWSFAAAVADQLSAKLDQHAWLLQLLGDAGALAKLHASALR
jgi:hypothetical protein